MDSWGEVQQLKKERLAVWKQEETEDGVQEEREDDVQVNSVLKERELSWRLWRLFLAAALESGVREAEGE